MTGICESSECVGIWTVGEGTPEIVVTGQIIVSGFKNFLHKNLIYLGGESTNSGPWGTHEKN